MEVNIEMLKECRDDVKSAIRKEISCLEERQALLCSYLRVLDAVDELISENDDLKEDLERKQSEIDDLSEQLQQEEAENNSLRMQMLSETGSNSQVFNDKVNGRFTKSNDKKKKEKKRWKRMVRKVL